MYTALQISYLIILFLVVSLSVLLCIRKGGKQQDFLYIYLGVSFSIEFLMYMIQIYLTDNANFGFLYNIYILFCTFFFLSFFNENQKKEFTVLNKAAFLLFLLIYIVFIFKNYREVNQVIGISFSLLYILYSLIWLYGKIKYPNLKSILDDPKFWVSCALLFWGVFFILRIIPRYLFDKLDEQTLIISQSFFFIINIIFYLLFFLALIKYNKEVK